MSVQPVTVTVEVVQESGQAGKRPRAKHTIAVDKRLIPLGTKVKIGKIVYTAEDTGGAIKGKRIDVYYSNHRQASAHGVKYRKIKVYI